MKKVPIEEIIEQTKIEPYDKSTAAWCQILNTHRNATHQMLLDALKYADNLLRDRYDHNSPCIIETIEAASFVEVSE